MRRFLLLLFFVISFCVTSSAEARKLALLIGVDEYVSIKPLECCVNDMKTLKEALMKIGFEEGDIQLLVTGGAYKNLPTKRNIERCISQILTSAQPGDMVFIALSGHGAQEGGNVYFCPPDVEADDLEGTCVSINKIMDLFANKCQAQFKWLVVDACRNDPSQSAKGIGGKGLQVIPTPPAGIALFQSCAEGEESWEDRASGNGYFTKNFAAALSGEADANRDGKLTLMEVCSWTTAKTKEQVQNNQNKSQRPYFSGSVSDFTLTENQNFPKAKEMAAAARAAMEAEDYDLAVEKYDAALALCPNYTPWQRDRDLANRLRTSKPKYDPMKIVVPDDISSIEDAYAKIKDGGIITIQPGRYELSSSLFVSRPVTFRGSTGRPEDIVIDCSTSDAFVITDGSPSFQNITVSSGASSCGGFSITGGTPKLFRCIVTSRRGSGIIVKGLYANPQVDSCTLKNCSGSGLYVLNNGLGTFNDCDIYGNSLAGIEVTSSGNPTITGCKIHDGKQGGVLVYGYGLGTFRDCEFYENSLSGIEVREAGNPTVTRCKFHDGKQSGALIDNNGHGTFSDCDFFENTSAAIVVRNSGDPTVSWCKFHDGKSNGIYVHESGTGKFSNCEIYRNENAGITVQSSGNPTVTECKFHDGMQSGVFVYDNGLGTFRDCELYRNTLAGIEVRESGNPTVTDCKIYDGKASGVYVNGKGMGTFNNCEIYRNEGSGIAVNESGNPTVTGCKIYDGKQGGIYVYDKGMGTYNNNTLERNYTNGKLDNWDIRSTAGTVRGTGNRPGIPSRSSNYYYYYYDDDDDSGGGDYYYYDYDD